MYTTKREKERKTQLDMWGSEMKISWKTILWSPYIDD